MASRTTRGIAGRLVVGAVVLGAALGCPKPVVPDAGEPDAMIDAAVPDAAVADASVDAGLTELAVEVLATSTDGGTEPLRFIEGSAEIDPARGFDVLVPIGLKDYRIRLMDWADQVVPSDDVAQSSDGGVAYRIDLVQPLHAGRTYTLLVDAQLGPEISDTAGHSFDDVRLTIKVRGEIAPDPGKKPKKPKKK